MYIYIYIHTYMNVVTIFTCQHFFAIVLCNLCGEEEIPPLYTRLPSTS